MMAHLRLFVKPSAVYRLSKVNISTDLNAHTNVINIDL